MNFVIQTNLKIMNSHKNLEFLEEEAINEALKGNYKKAIEVNKQIISDNPSYLDAHLRLGFAYFQINNFNCAKRYYQNALKIQPANQIAKNNLEKIRILGKKGKDKNDKKNNTPLDPNLFLNIFGKTKVIPLVNLGQINLLAKLKVGQKINLKIKKRRLEVRNKQKEYIGALPDDISKRLIYFILAKSSYSAYIKETSKKHVDIFVKEETKGKKVTKLISFNRFNN
ncbi:MAG: tetratricopeptide TPR_2 repeat protein, partial [uncultured bacterium]